MTITPEPMAERAFSETIETPLGWIEIAASSECVTRISFVEEPAPRTSSGPMVKTAITQLHEFFAGTRTEFSLPLAPNGTSFEKEVWNELTAIPFGRTCSYLDIANRLNNPGAIRAVGRANGANPIAIVIPCHRVIGSDGSLTGYGGGLWRKRWLLDHEARTVGLILF